MTVSPTARVAHVSLGTAACGPDKCAQSPVLLPHRRRSAMRGDGERVCVCVCVRVRGCCCCVCVCACVLLCAFEGEGLCGEKEMIGPHQRLNA